MANGNDFEPEKSELLLYLDNESSIYNQKKAIIENMKRKIGQGRYSPEAAVKGWLYWVDAGARQYCKENRCDLRMTFPLPLRREVAKEVAIREKELIDNGEYGAVKSSVNIDDVVGSFVKGTGMYTAINYDDKRVQVAAPNGSTNLMSLHEWSDVLKGLKKQGWKKLRKGHKPPVIRTPKVAKPKMPKLELTHVKLNRQGYTSGGTYYGVGAPLYEARNSDNGEYVTFRAQHRPMALGVLRNMFENPQHASVTDRFTAGQVRKFTQS